jgi:hypothetical protein
MNTDELMEKRRPRDEDAHKLAAEAPLRQVISMAYEAGKQAGIKEEGERIIRILLRDYPAITTWQCWEELKGKGDE